MTRATLLSVDGVVIGEVTEWTPVARGDPELPLFEIEAVPSTRFRPHLLACIVRGEALTGPERFVKNTWEKVSRGALEEEVRKIAERDGRVTGRALSATRFNYTTYRRRLGTLRALNAKLAHEMRRE